MFTAVVDPRLKWDRDVFVHLSIDNRSFASASSCQTTDVAVTLHLAQSPQRLPAQVQEATTAVTVGATSASTVSGSGGVALQTIRANVALSISRCEFSQTAPLETELSFFPLAIGDVHGAYYRGAIAVNTALFTAFAAIYFGGIILIHGGQNREAGTVRAGKRNSREEDERPPHTLWHTCHRFHFPGILVVPFAILLPGWVVCSVALIRHGPVAGDAVLGISVMLLIGGIVISCCYVLTKRFDAEFVDQETSRKEKAAQNESVTYVEEILFGVAHWKDNGYGFKYRFGPLFMDYRGNRHWYVVLETVFAIAASILEGFQPTTERGCAYVLVGLLVLSVIIFVSAVMLRPCISVFNTAHLIGQSAVVTASTLFLLIGLFEGSDTMAGLGEYIATCVVFFSGIKVLLDIAGVVVGKVREFLAKRRQKLNSSRRSPDLSSGSLEVSLLLPPPPERLDSEVSILGGMFSRHGSFSRTGSLTIRRREDSSSFRQHSVQPPETSDPFAMSDSGSLQQSHEKASNRLPKRDSNPFDMEPGGIIPRRRSSNYSRRTSDSIVDPFGAFNESLPTSEDDEDGPDPFAGIPNRFYRSAEAQQLYDEIRLGLGGGIDHPFGMPTEKHDFGVIEEPGDSLQTPLLQPTHSQELWTDL